jgi:hypothetical protein
MKPFFYALTLLVLCGCKSAPIPTESKIGYNPQTGLVTFVLPKDSHGALLDFQQTIGTNRVSLVLKDFSFTNNVLVLDAVGAGNIGMINAVGSLLNSMIGAGISAAGRAAPMMAPGTETTVLPDGTITVRRPEPKP